MRIREALRPTAFSWRVTAAVISRRASLFKKSVTRRTRNSASPGMVRTYPPLRFSRLITPRPRRARMRQGSPRSGKVAPSAKGAEGASRRRRSSSHVRCSRRNRSAWETAVRLGRVRTGSPSASSTLRIMRWALGFRLIATGIRRPAAAIRSFSGARFRAMVMVNTCQEFERLRKAQNEKRGLSAP